MSTGPTCGMSWGQNDGTFSGRPRDVGYTYFLNSAHKLIKFTLTGIYKIFTRLCSER